MKLFPSPTKVIELIKNKDSIANELKWQDSDWYFTKEGEEAYNNAKTPAQKTIYFFNYLKRVSKGKVRLEPLYRTAYIISMCMDSSSLPFSDYPNILDPDKNPLVKLVKSYSGNHSPVSMSNDSYGLAMLAAFKGEEDVTKFYSSECNPYTLLTYCNSDDTFSDNYAIERHIIGLFCVNSYDQYFSPYLYEMFPESDDEDDEFDDVDENYYDFDELGED